MNEKVEASESGKLAADSKAKKPHFFDIDESGGFRGMRAWPAFVRWLAVIPFSLLVALLVSALIRTFIMASGVDEEGVLFSYAIQPLASFFGVIAFVVAGWATAPSLRRLVAAMLGALMILANIFLLTRGLVSGVTTGATVIGVICAIWAASPQRVHAGNFFPSEYKQFSFKEGDLLVSKHSDGRFSVCKILKVDRFDLKKGSSINIHGQVFVATEDDYMLVVSASYGEASEFRSFEEAAAAAKLGEWKVKVGHVPNRSPGAAEGQTYVGHAPVLETELTGYRLWRQAFERGEAGVF